MITHSPELAHYMIFGKGADLVYVKKDNKSSVVKCLSNGEKILGLSRSGLYSEIDSRIFFGKSIILCEGYADELFLDRMARQLDLDLDGIGIMIVNTKGMGDFKKYCLLMGYFSINYVIVSDTDATRDELLVIRAGKYTGVPNEKFAIVGDSVEGNPRVFFIRDNLEKLLIKKDSNAYTSALEEVAKNERRKDSKPLVIKEFLEKQVSRENMQSLSLIVKPVFDEAIRTENL
jgi:predicted ATP-dependent endonuclease of OLD family